MGATPVIGGRSEHRPLPRGRPKEAPAAAAAETAVWGYLVHPSLLPTTFAPSGNAPEGDSQEQPTARKV